MNVITKIAEEIVERSMKASELRYRRLFETSQDGILILDAETGMIEDVNPYLSQIAGLFTRRARKKEALASGGVQGF